MLFGPIAMKRGPRLGCLRHPFNVATDTRSCAAASFGFSNWSSMNHLANLVDLLLLSPCFSQTFTPFLLIAHFFLLGLLQFTTASTCAAVCGKGPGVLMDRRRAAETQKPRQLWKLTWI